MPDDKIITDVAVVEEVVAEKSAKPSFSFDLDLMTYANYREMLTKRFGETYDMLEQVLTGWSFATPFEPGNLRKLPLEESAGVFRGIMNAINEDVEKLTPTIKVRFADGKWTMETIEQFIAYDEKGDYQAIAGMMLKIVRFPGIGKQPSAEHLTAVQGAAAFKAIMEQWQRIMNGKN